MTPSRCDASLSRSYGRVRPPDADLRVSVGVLARTGAMRWGLDMVARSLKRQCRGPSTVTILASLHYATNDCDVDLKSYIDLACCAFPSRTTRLSLLRKCAKSASLCLCRSSTDSHPRSLCHV